jgi:arylsulfatase A-like enzyme
MTTRLACAALLLTPLVSLRAADAPVTKPNIVFILADDLGWRDLGCYGGTSFETPNIDRLAAQGVRLTDAYAASPVCSPTRASILTGLHPARLGITGAAGHVPEVQLDKKLAAGRPAFRALNAESVTRLKTEYFTLPEALREAGYATAHFGKWHVGHNLAAGDRFEPKDQGFDVDFPHTPKASGPGGGYLAPWEFIEDPAITGRPGEHIDDRMADEAAKFIGEHQDRPFFVNFWAYSVHSPYNARRDYLEHFQAKAEGGEAPPNPLYAAMVKSLDDSVGRLMDAVEKAGLADRTIFVFFSDNGGWAAPPKGKTQPRGFESLPVTSNRPLASGKASIYEGGTRVPCIVAWPGKIKPGTVDPSLFESTDWFPTLLAMCGLPAPPEVKFDGVDQKPTLLGQGAVRDRVFGYFPNGGPGSHANIPGYLPSASVRLGDWKLIRFFADNDDGSDRFELYNLKDDLGESKNLADANPERVGELDELITGFLRDTEAVIPVRNPGYDPNPRPKKPKAKAKAESGASL